MKSPGSYYRPAVEYTPETECFRGRPLVSAPLEFDVGGKIHRVEFLVPMKGRGKAKGTESVRVKIGRSTGRVGRGTEPPRRRGPELRDRGGNRLGCPDRAPSLWPLRSPT